MNTTATNTETVDTKMVAACNNLLGMVATLDAEDAPEDERLLHEGIYVVSSKELGSYLVLRLLAGRRSAWERFGENVRQMEDSYRLAFAPNLKLVKTLAGQVLSGNDFTETLEALNIPPDILNLEAATTDKGYWQTVYEEVEALEATHRGNNDDEPFITKAAKFARDAVVTGVTVTSNIHPAAKAVIAGGMMAPHVGRAAGEVVAQARVMHNQGRIYQMKREVERLRNIPSPKAREYMEMGLTR